jgi:TRAP-type C4-dicarboxylate transport system substrate-binding protein
MKSIFRLACLTWLFVFFTLFCGPIIGMNAFSADKVYTIRLAEFYSAPSGSKVGGGLPKAELWWATEVEKRTNGRVKIEIGWSQAFGTVSEMPDLVRLGAVQMGAIAPGYYAKQMPLWNVLSAMPFMTYDPALTCEITWKLYETFPAMQEELAKNNMKILYIGVLNPYKFLSKKPIRALDDLKGIKIRSWGNMLPRALNEVGAVPVSISVSDAYEAFSKGVIDVQVGPADMIVAQGWDALGKYLTHANFTSPLAACGAINLDYWNSLPPDIQKIMEEVGREHKDVLIRILKNENEKSMMTMKEKGIEFIPFEEQKIKWRAMSPNFLTEWANQMESRGIPGNEFIKRYNENMKIFEKQ